MLVGGCPFGGGQAGLSLWEIIYEAVTSSDGKPELLACVSRTRVV